MTRPNFTKVEYDIILITHDLQTFLTFISFGKQLLLVLYKNFISERSIRLSWLLILFQTLKAFIKTIDSFISK